MTTLPPPMLRPPARNPRKRVRPKTYSVAVYMVFAIALLEVAMLISVFWLRAMVVSVNVGLPKAKYGTAGTVYLPNTPHATHPTGPPAVDSNGVALLPGLSLSTDHPGRLSVPTASDMQEQVSTLNEEAHVFLRQNDYPSALDLLVKAEDLDPRNPTTLQNLAETYYLMNNPARSKVYWQRLVDLGPGVGTVYGVAKDHVLLLDSGKASNPLRDPSSLPRQLYVNSVEKSPVDTRQGVAQFELRAVLKRKDPTADFDQKKLQPYVIFYQQMPDGSLVPDLGQRKGSFEDTFLFSGDKDSEAFTVTYVMPIPGTPGPNNTTQGEYYGFVIGLYYDKALQDVRSEPSDLCTRMALPQEIE